MAGPFAPSETHKLLAGVEQQMEERTLRKEQVRCIKKLRLEKRVLCAADDAKEQKRKLVFPFQVVKMPTLDEFRHRIMMQNKPVIITGAMEFWPALGRAAGPDRAWKNEEYIRRVAGLRTVPVELENNGTDSGNPGSQAAPSNKLGYLAQHRLFDQIPALGRDIVTPDYCTVQRANHTNDGEDEDITINCWFGPGGTVSPLHFDRKDNLLCQVVGVKYVRLYAPEESEKLYAMEGLLSNTSQVQVENPDNNKFPEFCHAKYVECILSEAQAGSDVCYRFGSNRCMLEVTRRS
uniref:JmjC domain-containing protein n=1 Tax=Hyaloperonospora arabidopsidis (strain Emoy2) TaxID=559515 RepID=M4BPS2_HYAAE